MTNQAATGRTVTTADEWGHTRVVGGHGDAGPSYLTVPIAEHRRTATPRYGLTRDGYSVRSGAPTASLIRLEGEKRWRRVMVWQFSNAGTCFVRVKGRSLIVRDADIPEANTRQVYTFAWSPEGRTIGRYAADSYVDARRLMLAEHPRYRRVMGEVSCGATPITHVG